MQRPCRPGGSPAAMQFRICHNYRPGDDVWLKRKALQNVISGTDSRCGTFPMVEWFQDRSKTFAMVYAIGLCQFV